MVTSPSSSNLANRFYAHLTASLLLFAKRWMLCPSLTARGLAVTTAMVCPRCPSSPLFSCVLTCSLNPALLPPTLSLPNPLCYLPQALPLSALAGHAPLSLRRRPHALCSQSGVVGKSQPGAVAEIYMRSTANVALLTGHGRWGSGQDFKAACDLGSGASCSRVARSAFGTGMCVCVCARACVRACCVCALPGALVAAAAPQPLRLRRRVPAAACPRMRGRGCRGRAATPHRRPRAGGACSRACGTQGCRRDSCRRWTQAGAQPRGRGGVEGGKGNARGDGGRAGADRRAGAAGPAGVEQRGVRPPLLPPPPPPPAPRPLPPLQIPRPRPPRLFCQPPLPPPSMSRTRSFPTSQDSLQRSQGSLLVCQGSTAMSLGSLPMPQDSLLWGAGLTASVGVPCRGTGAGAAGAVRGVRDVSAGGLPWGLRTQDSGVRGQG